jgi:hypothetical protein
VVRQFPGRGGAGHGFSKGEVLEWTIINPQCLVLGRKAVPAQAQELKKKSSLLRSLEQLLGKTAEVFDCQEAFLRVRRHVLARLVSFGRRTISGLLRAQNRHQQDWSADYRLYSRGRCRVEKLFECIRGEVVARLEPQADLVTGTDDSLLRKRGSKIHGVRFQRDPLSPPFQVNLVRGLRVLQTSAALPLPGGGARMVPIDFQHAVLPAKPRKTAPKPEWEAYKQAQAQCNINRLAQERLRVLREQMDQRPEQASRRLVNAVDGRLTNRTFLRQIPARTVVIGRIRKDAVLHQLPEQQPARGRKRKYGPQTWTPEQLLQEESIAFEEVKAFAAGREHAFKVKRLGPVLMRLDRGARPVQIVVIKPLGYRLKKGGKLLYRQPGFLMCTDLDMPLEKLLQDFLWRWEVEVNLRDEKTLLGVGQAQVRNPAATENAPALAVAAYGLLLLAGAKAYGPGGAPERSQEAKWYHRREDQRAATSELVNQLRRELWAERLERGNFTDFISAGAPEQKSQKCEIPLMSASLLSLN